MHPKTRFYITRTDISYTYEKMGILLHTTQKNFTITTLSGHLYSEMRKTAPTLPHNNCIRECSSFTSGIEVTVGCRWIYSCTYLGLFYVRDRKKVQVTRKRTCNGTCKYIRQCFGPCTYPCKSVWTVIILHENVLDRASTHVIPFRWNVK